MNTLKAGEVWLSQYSGNYFRIDRVDGDQVSATRLGYVENIGQLNEKSHLSRKRHGDSHVWSIATFNLKDFRRIARNNLKFEAWLQANAL
jgi:hypothetical protein